MIVFTKGGDDLELPIHASLMGYALKQQLHAAVC